MVDTGDQIVTRAFYSGASLLAFQLAVLDNSVSTVLSADCTRGSRHILALLSQGVEKINGDLIDLPVSMKILTNHGNTE